jgi:NAD(P)-dependent dehydrogenase (short-subunit alcohol dehydrogenase family)
MIVEPKTAIVTGDSQGIGRTLVETLLTQGYRVATCARRIEAQDKPNLLAVAGDVARPDFATQLARRQSHASGASILW